MSDSAQIKDKIITETSDYMHTNDVMFHKVKSGHLIDKISLCKQKPGYKSAHRNRVLHIGQN